MTVPQAIALVLATAAAASYLNRRFVGLPSTIGLMAFALAASLLLMALGAFSAIDVRAAFGFAVQLDFRALVLDGLLPFLLFAGALHVDLHGLRRVRLAVALLDTVGVAIATAVAGGLFYLAAHALGFGLTLVQALLFGALIAPTDPIAVLGILRSAGATPEMECTMAGESLFNDGVGIVLFLAVLGAATGGETVTAGGLARAFLVEGLGGIVFGAALGWAASRLLSHVDDYPLEIFLTMALASAGYAIAPGLHVSGPLTAVAAGLVVGSFGREVGMSANTQQHLDAYWTVVDEMLNAVLFLLVGLEMLVVPHDARHVALGGIAVLAVLAARWMSVAPVVAALRRLQPLGRGATLVLTWGGLRGAISIALALSIAPGELRDILLTATYVVVVFSVLVQGLTLGRLVRAYA